MSSHKCRNKCRDTNIHTPHITTRSFYFPRGGKCKSQDKPPLKFTSSFKLKPKPKIIMSTSFSFGLLSLLDTGLMWFKKKKSYIIKLTGKGLKNHLWLFFFQLQDDFHGVSGRVHDWHLAVVGVLFNFNIWFNYLQHRNYSTAASETVYLLTTAHDQWATSYERPCVLSSLSAVKGCAHSRPSEELQMSQPLAMREEWLIHFPLRCREEWTAEFEFCPPSCLVKGGWLHNLFTKPSFSVLKCSVLKHFSSCLVGSKWVLHFSQAKNLS